MIDQVFLIAAIIFFVIFLLPVRQTRRYCGILGWVLLLVSLFFHFPEYFTENNLVYPLIAICATPVIYVTAKGLLQEETVLIRLTMIAAVTSAIYAPFAFIEPLGNLLIGFNVALVQGIMGILNYPFTMADWNLFVHGVFKNRIILGCTGIQAIAIMLGVVAAVPTSWRQKGLSLLLVVPVIFGMNLLRNVFVFIAYTDQWFQFFPEIASNGQYGYESFFWSHNVISEIGISLLTLIIVAYGLFLIIPGLKEFTLSLLTYYYENLRSLAHRKEG